MRAESDDLVETHIDGTERVYSAVRPVGAVTDLAMSIASRLGRDPVDDDVVGSAP